MCLDRIEILGQSKTLTRVDTVPTPFFPGGAASGTLQVREVLEHTMDAVKGFRYVFFSASR